MAAFAAPPGLPVTLFAKIKAPGQNTGDLQISGNEIKISSTNKWSRFEHIYDQQSREKDIFDRDLQRVIPLIMDGYSVSIFVFGTFSSDKREILNGIIHLLFNQIWHQLSNKTKSFEIQLNSLEIVEDTMYDLQDMNNNNLMIEHSIDGPSVLNISTSTLTSNNDFSILFNEIMDNRTQQLTEFGPKSSKASFILTMKINYNDIHTLLQFVEFPAADKLIENPAELRMREGPTLNKELIGISNLINSFTDKSTEAPYEDCKTNMLLQEIIGGNSVSFGIICFDISNSKEINEILLQYANKINMIENYPVVNNDRMRGLLIKYYKRYHNVVRQLEAIKKHHLENINNNTNNISNTEEKLLEFRTLLIEKEKELISIHGDKDKLRESYAQFRGKYSELVERKTKLMKELILSEEKCLNISKTLIDLQIENNELKKNESVIRSELETKLIGAENDILETGMREQNLAEEIAELRKQTEELLSEKKTLSIEYVALRSNYMNLNEEFDEIKEEQQQLNVQLINLINTNKALEETTNKLQQENEIFVTKNSELLNNKEMILKKYKDYEVETLRLKTLCDKQSIEMVKSEVEISRIKTSMDANKSEYQKKWLKLSKEKEIELQNVTNQRTNETQHNRAQTQQLEREVDTLRGQIRVANRQITNCQQKGIEDEEKIDGLNKECYKFRDSLKEKTEEYRSKLLLYLQRVDTDNDNNNNNNIHIEDLKVTQKKLYQELITTHTIREEELMSESENERKKNRKLHQHLQTITQRFLLLQDFIKDIAPDTPLPVNININDSNKELMKSLSNELEQHDERLKNKINSLQRELEKEKRAHVNTAERAQTEQEGIQKELLSLKKIMKEEHSDCDPMSHQIKIEYQENINKLKTLQTTLQQQIEHNSLNQKKMENMHQKTLQQTSMQNDNEKQKMRMLESQINTFQNEMKMLNEKNKDLKRELSQSKLLLNNNNNKSPTNHNKQRRSSLHAMDSSLNLGSHSDFDGNNGNNGNNEKYEKQIRSLKKKYKENDIKYKKKIQELKNKISELEEQEANIGGGNISESAINGDSNVAWERVRKLEKEKAELISKHSALQSEYKTMEMHYKKEITKYKKLIAKLKKK